MPPTPTKHLNREGILSRLQIAKAAQTPLGARRDNTKRRFNPKTHIMHQGRAIPKNTATLRREDRHEKNKLARQHRGGLSIGDFAAVGGESGFDPETNKLTTEAKGELERRRRTSIQDRMKLQPGVIANIKKREVGAIGRAQTAASDVAQMRLDPLNNRFFTEVPLSTQGRSTGTSTAPAAAVAAHQARQLGRQPTQQEMLAGRGFVFNDPNDRLDSAVGDVNRARRDLAQASLDDPALQALGSEDPVMVSRQVQGRMDAIQQRLGFSPIEGRTRTPLNEQQQARFDQIKSAQAEGGISVVEQQELREQEAAFQAQQDALAQAPDASTQAETALRQSQTLLNFSKAASIGIEAGFDGAKAVFESQNRLLASPNLADEDKVATVFSRDMAAWQMEHFQRRMSNPGHFKALVRDAKLRIQSGDDPDAAERLVASEFPGLFNEMRPTLDDKGKELPANRERRRMAETMFKQIVNRIMFDSLDSGAK